MVPDGYMRVATASQLPEGKGRKCVVGDEEVALWHVDGRFYAISNVCAHQHVSALHAGIREGLQVTCPMHGWTYSLESGIAASGNGRVRVFRVLVEGDSVYIEVPESS